MASPVQTQQISSLLAEIDSATRAIRDPSVAKDVGRKRALAAAKDLVVALESPTEVIYQHAWNVSAFFLSREVTKEASFGLTSHLKGPDRLCVRLAVTLRIFHLLAAREGRPVGAEELASLCGAECSFVSQWS